MNLSIKLLIPLLYLTATVGAQANLIAHYTFDGDANDSTANGNDLTAYADDAINTPVINSSGGVSGGYASFDGQNLFNTTFVPVQGNADRTFSMFVRSSTSNTGSTGTTTTMFAGWGDTNLSPRVRFDFGLNGGTDNQLRNEYNAGATTSNSSVNIIDGEWHHVAVTWEEASNTATFYLDGTAYGTGTADDLLTGNEVGLTLGGDTRAGGNLAAGTTQGGFRYLTGDLDDVRVYNTALDSTQIANLSAIPEPSALLLLGGAGLLGLLRRRR